MCRLSGECGCWGLLSIGVPYNDVTLSTRVQQNLTTGLASKEEEMTGAPSCVSLKMEKVVELIRA